MCLLLETLGQGLLSSLTDAFVGQLPGPDEEAPERLRARAAESPSSLDLGVRLGLMLLREERLADGVRVLQRCVSEHPGVRQPLLALACGLDQLGQADEAMSHLERAAQMDAKDPAAPFAIGLVLERSGHPDLAGRQYDAVLRICPRLRNAYERLAALAVREGAWDSAVVHYTKLVDLEPDDGNIRLLHATLLLASGASGAAVQAFQQALLVEPECNDELLHKVETVVDDRSLRGALEHFEQLVRRYPGVSEFHVHLGDLYVKQGDDEQATAHYREALRLHPDFLEATVKLGTQHLRKGRLGDAAQSFNVAAEMNDRLLLTFVGLGVAQRAAGRLSEAQATFELAASLEPNSTLLFAETARLHRQADSAGGSAATKTAAVAEQGNMGELLRQHRRALLRFPQQADLIYRYGMLLRNHGDVEGAADAFRDAVRIHPPYAKAWVRLGVCEQELRRGARADDAFARALRLTRAETELHYNLAVLFAQPNRFYLAVESFEEAAHAGGETFRANLALALQGVGMVDRAAANWRALGELAGRAAGPLQAPRVSRVQREL